MTTSLSFHAHTAPAARHLLTYTALFDLRGRGLVITSDDDPLTVHIDDARVLIWSSGERQLLTVLAAVGASKPVPTNLPHVDADNMAAVHEALGLLWGVESDVVNVPLVGRAS